MGDYILLDSPMIENAVKITANVKNAPRRFGRSSLKDTPVVSGGASDEYNGMHKLFLVSKTEGEGEEAQIINYIYIADGATFDSKTGESAASRVEVNGISFDLQPQKFTLENHSVYVYAVFSAATPTSEASVSYGVGAELPKNDATDKYYYLIGRVLLKDGTYSVHQDHENKTANGIIVILWSKCYE